MAKGLKVAYGLCGDLFNPLCQCYAKVFNVGVIVLCNVIESVFSSFGGFTKRQI